MVNTVIFDMDGVLIDSEPLHHFSGKQVFSRLGIVISDDEYQTFTGTSSHHMWEIIRQRYGLNHCLQELVDMTRTNFFNCLLADETLTALAGVNTLLSDLQQSGFKLAVASSSPLRVIEHVVERFGFDKFFTVLVTGDDVENSKPAPDIFLLAAHRLGVSPEECAVIEDSYNGVTAAKNAGMKCIGFRNSNSGNQDLSQADVVIDQFAKISSIEIEQL